MRLGHICLPTGALTLHLFSSSHGNDAIKTVQEENRANDLKQEDALTRGMGWWLQVLNTLFFVETRRIEGPRNILQLLSMNTRRTKVVELSSGTHR